MNGIEAKVLYNVLNQIKRGESPNSAPDKKYVNALSEIGLIEMGWDTTLTKFGHEMISLLQNTVEDSWGT